MRFYGKWNNKKCNLLAVHDKRNTTLTVCQDLKEDVTFIFCKSVANDSLIHKSVSTKWDIRSKVTTNLH